MRKNEAIEGELVICNHQTDGKGQRGNQWRSEPDKNLTFSVILSPAFLAPDKNFQLNIIVSLALFDTLRHFSPDQTVSIKWPNDMLVNGKKTCGILIENTINSGAIRYSVVGIGLNVNQTRFNGLPNAGSLQSATGTLLDRNAVLNRFLSEMETYYIRLKQGQISTLEQQYTSQLYGFEQVKPFESADGYRFEGKITGVTPEGKLRIQTTSKSLVFGFKEVKFLF